MEFKDNLKKYRLLAKLTQPELAEKLGWDGQGRISHYETGKRSPSIPELIRIADVLGIDVGTLISGENFILAQTVAKYGTAHEINKVPFISFFKVSNFADIIKNYNGEMHITTAKIKARTFATMVEGDSMLPEFPPGRIIVVEPDRARSAISGDYVVARDLNNEATLKQLIKDGSDWYLKPLNDRYPIKRIDNPELDIIGVVIQSVINYK
jgi:SOS-response transcriptional repressor LexA